VRSDLAVPVLEPRQGGAEGTVVERDELVRKPLFLEGADEPLLDGDAKIGGAEVVAFWSAPPKIFGYCSQL